MTDITDLATTTALNAIQNWIPNVSTLVKKEDYNEKIKKVRVKYLTKFDHNKFMNAILDDAKIYIAYFELLQMKQNMYG